MWIDTLMSKIAMGDATLQSMYNNGDESYIVNVTVNALKEVEVEAPSTKETWQAILTISPYYSSYYVLRAWKKP